jgi:hypothetical protein
MKILETFENTIKTDTRKYALAITDEGNLCIAGNSNSNPHEFKLMQIVKDRTEGLSILKLWGAATSPYGAEGPTPRKEELTQSERVNIAHLAARLSKAFVWGQTKEGHKYWERVRDNLNAIALD